MGCAPGALSKLLVEPGIYPDPLIGAFDASSEIYDFNRENIKKHGVLIGGNAITGTRSSFANRVREGSYQVGGRIFTYTCAADLDKWLPRILGANEAATDTFKLAELLPSFGVLIDRVSGCFLYRGGMVDTAVWRGQAGPGDGEPELVEQILDLQFLSEDSTVSFPATPPMLSTAANRAPYIVADSVLTIGSAFQFHNFVVVVRNHLQPRWVNSLTPTALCPQDRTVMVRATFPFTKSSDAVLTGLYQLAARNTGVTSTLVLRPSGSAYGTTFKFTGLQWAQTSPVVRGKDEIVLNVDFAARKTGADDELVVVNDNTT
ncbi:MAG: hypothetical protein GXY58_08155 [Planctomycetaceae bacterium]|nr:hypothetical protein [Planctomycetaceae bacterium]